MSSPLDLYLRALEGVTAVADSAPSERWEACSPCPAWSARQLLGHVIDAQRQVVAMLTGQGPHPPVSDLAQLARLAGTDPAKCWRRTQLDTADALARVDLDASVATPLGTRTVADVLAIALIEPLIHGCDLAVATGQRVTLDPEAVQVTLPAVQALGRQLDSGMYQPALPTPPDATAQDQLLAALGRTSSWLHMSDGLPT